MRKLIAAGAAGLALTGGSLALAATGLGTAGAQEQPGTSAQQPAPDGAQGQRGQRLRAHRQQVKGAVKVAAEAIGITPQELGQELRDGRSVAQVAGENGVDRQVVVDALVAAANSRIDQAVANGRIDATRAAELKAKVPEKVNNLVDHTR